MEPFKKKQGFLRSFSLRTVLTLLLAAALVLTGCSGQKGDSAKAPAQSQEQTQTGEAPAGALPTPGFTLSMSVRGFPF